VPIGAASFSIRSIAVKVAELRVMIAAVRAQIRELREAARSLRPATAHALVVSPQHRAAGRAPRSNTHLTSC
jgi:hypothetical protein